MAGVGTFYFSGYAAPLKKTQGSVVYVHRTDKKVVIAKSLNQTFNRDKTIKPQTGLGFSAFRLFGFSAFRLFVSPAPTVFARLSLANPLESYQIELLYSHDSQSYVSASSLTNSFSVQRGIISEYKLCVFRLIRFIV